MTDTATWHSLDTEGHRISYDRANQRWEHEDAVDPVHGPIEAELRIACDATCGGCDFPEIGYAPAREEFVCSRCGWTSKVRPAS